MRRVSALATARTPLQSPSQPERGGGSRVMAPYVSVATSRLPLQARGKPSLGPKAYLARALASERGKK